MDVGQGEGTHTDHTGSDNSCEMAMASTLAMTGGQEQQDHHGGISIVGMGKQGKGGGNGRGPSEYKGPYTKTAFRNMINMIMQILGAM